ncbi:MAG TPA: hypothetical protein VMF30_03380 [Pirellulales bacterium]|nr:hypothetical protein [Pirellulales bacterium]
MKWLFLVMGGAGSLLAAGCASQPQPYAYYPQGYTPTVTTAPTYAPQQYYTPTTAPVVQTAPPVVQTAPPMVQTAPPMVQTMPMQQGVMYQQVPQQACLQCCPSCCQ